MTQISHIEWTAINSSSTFYSNCKSYLKQQQQHKQPTYNGEVNITHKNYN